MSRHVTTLAALAIALLSGSPLAAARCTVGTLKGRYVFAGRGFIEALEPGVQRMHYGAFAFDGSGKLTGRQSSSRGGKIGRENLEGAYWDLYVTGDGRKGHIIRMDDGNMAVRTFEK